MFKYEKSMSKVSVNGGQNCKEIYPPLRLKSISKAVYETQPSISHGEVFEMCCAYNQPLSQFNFTSDLEWSYELHADVSDYVHQMKQRNEGQTVYFTSGYTTLVNCSNSSTLVVEGYSGGGFDTLTIHSETPKGIIIMNQRFDPKVDILNKFFWEEFKRLENISGYVKYSQRDGTYRIDEYYDDRVIRVVFDPWGVISEIYISINDPVFDGSNIIIK
ncbi:hypothetical protein [Serratia aquatilis]|uniref:Uncharacterized protein n=1 Tax=Serratia aquatilis TaxID=1737515 RepID=A0ABV6EG17_9GAMM